MQFACSESCLSLFLTEMRQLSTQSLNASNSCLALHYIDAVVMKIKIRLKVLLNVSFKATNY